MVTPSSRVALLICLVLSPAAAQSGNYAEPSSPSPGAGSSVTTGDWNTFVGEAAGYRNTEGDDNTFVGEDAGYSNTTGRSNTFVGGYGTSGTIDIRFGGSYELGSSTGAAGWDNTTGIANAFFGAGAGTDNGTGSGNTFLGHSAGAHSEFAHFNTFVGCEAGWENNRTNGVSDANRNTYVGFDAGSSNRGGSDNVGIGAFSDFGGAGFGTERNRCTFLGADIDADADDIIAIGDDARISGTRSIAIGNAVRATADHTIAVGRQTTVSGANSTAIGNDVTVTAPNEVQIGNSTVASIGGPVNWTALSDGRFKQDVTEDVPGLAFVERLRPVTYRIDAEKAHAHGGRKLPDSLRDSAAAKAEVRYTGFIAQEVLQAANDAGYDFSGVKVPEDATTQSFGLRYAEFVVPLAKAVQELNAKVDVQAAALQGYENAIATMNARLEQLEARIAATPN